MDDEVGSAPPPAPAGDDGISALTERRARRRRLTRWCGIAIGVVLLGLSPFGLDRALHADRVLRGVWVSGLALSGLGPAEAADAVEQLGARLRAAPLQVRVGAAAFELRPETVGYRVDVARTVAQARHAGRQGGLANQLGWWLDRWLAPLDLPPAAALDEEALERTLARWESSAIDDPPFPGGLRADGANVLPDYPRPGRVIDRAAATELLLRTLARETRGVVALPLTQVAPSLDRAAVDEAARRAQELVQAPLELTTPDGALRLRFTRAELASALEARLVDGAAPRLELLFAAPGLEPKLAPLRASLERPSRDATFEIGKHDRVYLQPAEPGIALRTGLIATALMHAAHAPGRTGPLPLDRSAQPKLDTEAARALGITGLVSSFTTRHPCCRPRVDNIHRIADLLDGTIVRPGETFSVNEHVGQRTRKNGFVPAPTIEHGEMVDTVGGGISQFATTLFNAVFHGGYDIIERQPHTYYFPRYPEGHEATLSFPKPDLIFRNDTEAGLLIRCLYGKTHIKIKLYGDNGGRKVRAKVSRRRNVLDPPMEYVANPELDPEEDEVVLEKGQLGWTIIVARILTFPDGTKKEEKRKVIYNPRVRRIEIHPCLIPEGEDGYTGEECPAPEESEPPDSEESGSSDSEDPASAPPGDPEGEP